MLFTKDACIEISAFTIIVWYAYHPGNTFKLMALVRTVLIQASIWFIAIIIVQMYIQVNFSSLAVRPFTRFL